MRQEVFELPSGVKIKFRQLMLNDESVLADAIESKRSDVEKTIKEIVTSCAVSVEDPGPYPFLEIGNRPNWMEMANGDYFETCLKLRGLSYKEGSKIEVDLQCSQPSCKHAFSWEVDLVEDLVYQPLPEESKEKIKNGEPFEVVIGGKKVQYTLALGKTEGIAARYIEQYPKRSMAAKLRSRIISVEGVSSKDILDWLDGQGKSEYPGLTADEGEDLRDAFDRVDCGVDTTVEVECPKCREWFEFVLPFTGIFLPGKGISQRKREARRKKRRKTEEPTEE